MGKAIIDLEQGMGLWSRIAVWLGVVLCLCVWSQEARGAAYVLEGDAGRINLYSGLVSARGQGFLPQGELDQDQARRVALRQALVEARQNLWSTLQGVRIQQDLTLAELMQENSRIRDRVQGLVHNARILDRISVRDEFLLVSIGLDLWGEFARLAIPEEVWFSGEGVQQDFRNGGSLPLLQRQLLQARARAYTGLVLQARGLDLKPALVCTVQDQEGNQVFGPSQVDPRKALDLGMMRFVQRTGQELQAGSRVGPNPLRIRARQTGSEPGCNLVVDSSSADLLRQVALQPGNFLQECRVVIELDPPPDQDLQEYRLLDR
ncbi:MAG: hypothetical protein ACLFRL_05730 [Desulfohalobiaceae bacterium]